MQKYAQQMNEIDEVTVMSTQLEQLIEDENTPAEIKEKAKV